MFCTGDSRCNCYTLGSRGTWGPVVIPMNDSKCSVLNTGDSGFGGAHQCSPLAGTHSPAKRGTSMRSGTCGGPGAGGALLGGRGQLAR